MSSNKPTRSDEKDDPPSGSNCGDPNKDDDSKASCDDEDPGISLGRATGIGRATEEEEDDDTGKPSSRKILHHPAVIRGDQKHRGPDFKDQVRDTRPGGRATATRLPSFKDQVRGHPQQQQQPASPPRAGAFREPDGPRMAMGQQHQDDGPSPPSTRRPRMPAAATAAAAAAAGLPTVKDQAREYRPAVRPQPQNQPDDDDGSLADDDDDEREEHSVLADARPHRRSSSSSAPNNNNNNSADGREEQRLADARPHRRSSAPNNNGGSTLLVQAQVVHHNEDAGDSPIERSVYSAELVDTIMNYSPRVLIRILAVVLLLAIGAIVVGGVCGAGYCGGGAAEDDGEASTTTDVRTTTAPPTASPTSAPAMSGHSFSHRAPAIPATTALPTAFPSGAPSFPVRTSEILDFVRNITVSNETLLYPAPRDDTATPEELALQWLIEDDPLQLSVETNQTTRLLQRYALAALYYSSNGEFWTLLNNGWLGSDDECDWRGIFCNASIVTEIELSQPISMALSLQMLHFCQTSQLIDLADNPKLGGQLPPSIGNWEHLEHFQCQQMWFLGHPAQYSRSLVQFAPFLGDPLPRG